MSTTGKPLGSSCGNQECVCSNCKCQPCKCGTATMTSAGTSSMGTQTGARTDTTPAHTTSGITGVSGSGSGSSITDSLREKQQKIFQEGQQRVDETKQKVTGVIANINEKAGEKLKSLSETEAKAREHLQNRQQNLQTAEIERKEAESQVAKAPSEIGATPTVTTTTETSGQSLGEKVKEKMSGMMQALSGHGTSQSSTNEPHGSATATATGDKPITQTFVTTTTATTTPTDKTGSSSTGSLTK